MIQEAGWRGERGGATPSVRGWALPACAVPGKPVGQLDRFGKNASAGALSQANSFIRREVEPR